MIEAVKDGTIDVIATDHAPVSYTHLDVYKRQRYVLGDIKLHMLSAPSLPITPYNIFDGKRAALTGAAYGLLFGAGLILLYGCTRRTVRREEEIASKLHLLCLGTLPKVCLLYTSRCV